MNRLTNKSTILPALLLLYSSAHSQTGLHISTGTNVVMTGSPSIVLNNCDFTNDGTLTQGSSNVVFTGSATNSQIGGSGATTLHDLTIDKTSTSVTLMADINVENNVSMMNGLIELNNFDLDLGSTGMLMNESETSRITGATGGRVLRMENLNAPTGINPGNIGAEITTTANLGSTQIIRGHEQQTGVSSGIGIARYYDIIPAAGQNAALNATLDFHYFDGELSGITESELNMSVKTAPAGWWFMIGENGHDLLTNVLTKTGIDTFGRHTLTSELDNPLPIQLVAFTGRLQNRQTLLNWQVANEAGILKYDVQRSADGKSFKGFTSANAKGQNQLSYSYDAVDPSPFSGYTYYRLKVYENNGSTSYSQVVKVNITQSVATTVYPNPVTDRVNVEFYSEMEKNISIRLLDATGKLVSEKTVQCVAGNNKLEWDLSALAQATYYLQMEGEHTQIKLIKL